jgi:tetratricopeptide (TPR) repeat protein
MAWLSEAYLLAGRREEARAGAARALARAQAQQERGHEAWSLRLLGEIAVQGEPPQAGQAEAHYRQALALAEELGMRPLQAHCHHSLGTLYVATGQQEQARAELSAALDLYQAMEMTFWLPETEAALAQVEGR